MKTTLIFLTAIVLCGFSMAFPVKRKQTSLPKVYQGNWETQQCKITVRKRTGVLKYEFTDAQVPVHLELFENNRAKGSIGKASFDNATVTVNKGNPEKTGIAYIIHCGTMGALFDADPSGDKNIEIWVKPMKEGENLKAEIRLKETLDVFPMGECEYTKSLHK